LPLLTPQAGDSAASKFLYFFLYKFFGGATAQSAQAKLLIGYCAEMSHKPLTIPLERLGNKLQQTSGNETTLQVVQDLLAQPVSELYKGWHFAIPNALQQAIQYVANELFRAAWLKRTKKTFLTTLEAFCIGAVARAIATTVIYPAIRLKVVMQTTEMPPGETLTPWGAVGVAMRRKGLLGLYEGWTAEVVRGVLSSALMLTCKEKIDEVTKKALLGMVASKPS